MDITPTHRATIINAMRDRRIKQQELAEHMGYSKPWASKLLSDGVNQLKTISDSDAAKIQDFLGIAFYQIRENEEMVSDLALRIDAAMLEDQQFQKVVTALADLVEGQTVNWTPRFFSTKEMTQLGQEITRLVFANEGKPGKIARETLRMVSQDRLERTPAKTEKIATVKRSIRPKSGIPAER